MRKKLIALDLDGTLLNQDSQLSQKSKDILRKLDKEGHRVVITTGRPYWMAIDYYKELGIDQPMINFNGALTHHPGKNWAYEHRRDLEKDYLLDMVQNQEDFQADFIASQYPKKFYIHRSEGFEPNPNFFGMETLPEASRFSARKVTKGPCSVLLQTRTEDRKQLAQEMMERYQNDLYVNTWGGPYPMLECSAKGVTKAYALNYLLDIWGMDKADLIAFGDENNDQEMLQLAGLGYAMKNCNPDLLEYANRQTQFSNQEDGVARELEGLLL